MQCPRFHLPTPSVRYLIRPRVGCERRPVRSRRRAHHTPVRSHVLREELEVHRRCAGRPGRDLSVAESDMGSPPARHERRARWCAHLLAVVRAQAYSVHRERGEVRRGVHEVGALVPARAAGTREVRCGVACHRERPGGGARATRPMSLNPRSSTVMSTRWGLRLARASAAAPPAAALTTVSLLDPRASDGVEELPVCDLARLFSCAGGVPRPGTSLDGSTRSARATTPVMLSSRRPATGDARRVDVQLSRRLELDATSGCPVEAVARPRPGRWRRRDRGDRPGLRHPPCTRTGRIFAWCPARLRD